MVRRAYGTVLAAVLVGIAAAIINLSPQPAPRPAPTAQDHQVGGTASALTAPSPAAGPHPDVASVDPRPVRLVIASIHLDAKIEPRGLDAKKNLDTAASPDDVAWYDLGPEPGQPGNAIINGHVDWWTGDAVFTHLGRVRAGETIQVVRADGRVVTFRITSLQRVNAGTRIPSLFAPSTHATLTLITCAGVWNPLTFTNTQRLLVNATVV